MGLLGWDFHCDFSDNYSHLPTPFDLTEIIKSNQRIILAANMMRTADVKGDKVSTSKDISLNSTIAAVCDSSILWSGTRSERSLRSGVFH